MINPLIPLDYPDPDVIRVGDTWYMASTTMHFMPGGEILRSRNLVDWEHAAYVFESLEDLPAHRLEGGSIYGQGMWAPCLRHHQGRFYCCFSANDTGRTYLFTASRIEGPWQKQLIQGFYHDCSLLFDDDRVFLASGNTSIRITELASDLSGPKTGGLDRVAVCETGNPILGYEGSHFYRIKDRYVLCLIHSRPERWRRVQACFVADSLEGEFTGGDVLDDDRGYHDQGVAQGGLVDTPAGDWYAILFQDHGAVGRLPVLVPVTWEAGFPVLGRQGKIPPAFALPGPASPAEPPAPPVPLTGSDDFRDPPGQDGQPGLRPCWQWNHQPNPAWWQRDPTRGVLRLTAGRVCQDLVQVPDLLTQRLGFPRCQVEVTVRADGLQPGDRAGLAAFQGAWGLVAIARATDGYQVCMANRPAGATGMTEPVSGASGGIIQESRPLGSPEVRLRLEVDFQDMKDEARFFYHSAAGWQPIGPVHQLYFKLDHFCGCRAGLFVQATRSAGGTAEFSDFSYRMLP